MVISSGVTKKIGLIGMGKMGKPMGHNLLRRGFSLWVYDVVDAPVQQLSSAGAQADCSPQEVAEYSDIMILSLPDVRVLQSVMRGGNGVLSADLHDKVIIDTTTSTMQASTELADEVAGRSGRMIDSPVTGGVWGAQNASLRFFVGGDKAAFDHAQDVYATLGKCAVYHAHRIACRHSYVIHPRGHSVPGFRSCSRKRASRLLPVQVEADGPGRHAVHTRLR
jgi:3-hydroxyisobutyrate dehydrogenase-like beta-hydroxyacid dehydrogenase